jgi:hypothetical protein
MLKLVIREPFLDFQAQSAGFGATAHLMHLALSGPSLRRKLHESVMSRAMNLILGSGPKR